MNILSLGCLISTFFVHVHMLSWIMSAFLLASVKSIRNTGDIHFSAFPSVHFSGATRMVRKPCPAAPAMSGPGPSPASSYRVPSHVQQINQEAAKLNLLIALIVSNCVTKVTSAYFIILYIYIIYIFVIFYILMIYQCLEENLKALNTYSAGTAQPPFCEMDCLPGTWPSRCKMVTDSP